MAAGLCLAATGGPDGGGYYWYDQEESHTFFADNWIDISSTDTLIGSADDTYWLAGSLGFDFVFYGEDRDDVYIGSNGVVYFVDMYLGRGFTHFPTLNSCFVDSVTAPWWCDLDATDEGAIYYQEFDDHFVVMFDNIPPWEDTKGKAAYNVTAILIGWESTDGSTDSDLAFLYNSSCEEPNGSIGMQGDRSTGTELQYMPITCEPGDWYLLTTSDAPFSAIEESTWGQIKASVE
ncbi:hypothetical protein K8R78_05910 [bacterium]|nr:hypothetical protein [bacterium]